MISTRLIALLALAASLPLSESKLSDGWSVSFTDPKAGSVWNEGSQQTVRWNTDHPSTGNTNPKGELYLVTNSNGHTKFQRLLTSGFNVTTGQVEVTAPDISGTYQVALTSEQETLGQSPSFTIAHE